MAVAIDSVRLRGVWDRLKTGFQLRIGPVALQLRARRTVRRSAGPVRAPGPSALWKDHVGGGVETTSFPLLGPLERLRVLHNSEEQRACNQKDTALIVGVGPGLGTALARRLAAAGMDVALVARRVEKLAPLVQEMSEQGRMVSAYPCDAADEPSVAQLFRLVRDDFGDPHLVIYNCEAFGPGGILETNPHAFEDCWRVNCFGAFLVSRQALPAMVSRGSGTIVFTGPTGSLRGRAGYVNLAVGKSGARMLAQSMAREFGPKGIHVAHVVLDGPILTPMNLDVVEQRGVEGLMDPEAIAETIFQIHLQPKTSWTNELDLRSSVEPF